MRPEQRAALTARSDWLATARPDQITPDGDWRTWVILAGRGWGKTRTGAEDVAWAGMANPGWRIAIVAPTSADARDTCIEGNSGLISVLPREAVRTWSRSLGELILVNGTRYNTFSADAPERLRGPQHNRAWCFVAGTMVATPTGERSIESLRPGDFVLTRKGPRAIIANAARQAVVGRVLFSNGKELVGTEDHPVYSLHGWTNLSALCKGSKVCAIGARNGMAGLGISTEPDGAAITSGLTRRRASALCGFTGSGGLQSAAQSLMALTFTTWTETAKTTKSTICNLSNMRATVLSIALMKARKLIGQAFQSRQRFALTAAWFASGGALAAMPSARSVSKSAPKHAGAFQRFAGAAGRNSCRGVETIAASVVSTWQRTAVSEVYCLKVAGEPEYFANGILVHNCDELAAWRYPEAWDQLMFGLRLGQNPQAVVTTTPKPTPLVKSLVAASTSRVTRGSTFDNAANLAPSALEMLKLRYEGTRLGRQELDAEILGDLPGALWSLANLDAYRLREAPPLGRIVVAVDPAVTATEDSDEHGIIVAGIAEQRGIVLEDASLSGSPNEWARRAVSLYRSWNADAIVIEVNQGGDMVAHTIRTIDPNVKIKEVRASRGKHVRAEPIAALYEQGRVAHVGSFPALEAQMTQMTASGYEGEGSPDRVDALVWALTDLFPAMTQRAVDSSRYVIPARKGWMR